MQIPPTIGCRFLGWLWRAAALLLVVLAPARALAQPAPAAEPKEDAAEAPLSTPATLPSLPATDADKARGATIVRIDVVGNQRVTKSDILTYLRERVGTAFAPETLSQDVRELWNSGYFDDIVVELDRGDDGVGLRFVVRERPSIGQVVFTGNDEIDSDDLLEAIEVKDGTILSYPAVQRSVQKIRDMYAEKGFFLAEVKSEVIPQKNNEVVIRFNIKEEAQVSVRRITFIGNHSISDASAAIDASSPSADRSPIAACSACVASASGCGTSSAVTSAGPVGAKPSNVLPINHCPPGFNNCQSRAETSLPTV